MSARMPTAEQRAAMRIAGHHGDVVALRAAALETPNAEALIAITRSYEEGKRAKARGVPCGCPSCVNAADAITVTKRR